MRSCEPVLAKLLQSTQTIRLNGAELDPLPTLWPWVEDEVGRLSPIEGSLIHGDLCFSNILYDLRGGICRLIDPRGSFGQAGLYGDPRYDLAKLNHSVRWLYDFIVADLFSVTDDGDFDYELAIFHRAYHGDIAAGFAQEIFAGYAMAEIELITGLLFASMIPLARRSTGPPAGLRPARHRDPQRLSGRRVRICIDLDGVVCQLRRPNQDYAELEPVPGAPEALRSLRSAGHQIILSTARHMKTCDGNPGWRWPARAR